MSDPGPSNTADAESVPAAEPSTSTPTETDKARGRKRAKTQPAPPASSLVVSRGQGTARSPTPPTRVIKSTYGGNLFTADDVLYLKKYIDYCQEQGLVLSLREICERVAVKARNSFVLISLECVDRFHRPPITPSTLGEGIVTSTRFALGVTR